MFAPPPRKCAGCIGNLYVCSMFFFLFCSPDFAVCRPCLFVRRAQLHFPGRSWKRNSCSVLSLALLLADSNTGRLAHSSGRAFMNIVASMRCFAKTGCSSHCERHCGCIWWLAIMSAIRLVFAAQLAIVDNMSRGTRTHSLILRQRVGHRNDSFCFFRCRCSLDTYVTIISV